MKLSDLTLIQWLGIVLVINGAITGSVGEMTDLLGAIWAKHLVSIATIGSGIVGGVITMFGGIGTQAQNVRTAGGRIEVVASPQTSPTLAAAALDNSVPGIIPAPGASAALSVIAKVLIAAFLLSLFLAGNPAMAQTAARRTAQPAQQGPVLTGDLINDAKNGFKGDPSTGVQLTGNLKKDAQAVWDKIVGASNADLKYASQLAANANTPASAVRKQCWDEILATNEQANGLNLKDANGNAVPPPDPKLFTQIEQAAEVLDALSPQGKLFTSCAGAAQLAQANVIQFISAAVAGVAGMAKLAPIPGL